MLKHAIISPHSPLLLPSQRKGDLSDTITHTLTALDEIKNIFSSDKPDGIIIISPHGFIHETDIALNIAPEYTISFQEFGDFSSLFTAKPDYQFISHLLEMTSRDFSIITTSRALLDHGASVPLFMLAQTLVPKRIVPLSYSLADPETLFQFGRSMGQSLRLFEKSFAVIASGELSHFHNDENKEQRSQAQTLDDAIRNAFLRNQHDKLRSPAFVKSCEDSSLCGLRSFILLSGILDSYDTQYSERAYESPFGVGWLTSRFTIA